MPRLIRAVPISSILSVFLILLTAAIAMSYPMFGEERQVNQPDGTVVNIKIFGDEYYRFVESMDGFTLVRDQSTGVICYARVSADGTELESTGVRVDSVDPMTLGIQPHVRISKESLREKVRLARAEAGMEMPGQFRPDFAAPSTGNVLGLVVLIDFDDEPATVPASDVDDFCNLPGYSANGNNGSVWDYFNDVSDGALNYTCWVMPSYYRADSLKSYYDDCSVKGGYKVQLITEVLLWLDANGHDFSVYDSNGDGYIDAINMLYAGNASCPWTYGLWPSSNNIHDLLTLDGKKTDRFQLTDIGGALTIGTFCHENGHMVGGFPDLYDYDYDAYGVGRWCLMGYQYSTNPQEVCAWLKIQAGWATPTVIGSPQTINIGPSSNNDNIYKFPSGAANEYFLVENRRQTGHDANLPDAGLLFTHIDENGDHNANEMLPGSHYPMTVMQADGDWDLENNNNSGDSTDLYAGPTYDALAVCTDPNTDWWDGSQSGFNFNNISSSATTMSFDYSEGDDPPVAQCKSYSYDADTECCIDVSVDDIDNGSYDPQGSGDIESILITAVDGNPVTPASSVEVCGDGVHLVTLTITDLCDNTDECDASVEVVNDPPVALCKFYEADADTDCCIVVHKEDVDNGSYDPDGAGDIKSFGISHVDGNPITLADSVQICGNGTHTVTLTITDWCDSTSSCTTDVDVNDVTPPDIAVSLDRYCLWPPNHKYVDINATVEVEDNCDPDPDWVLESITSDEPDNGKGDGNTINDIAEADTGTSDVAFQLRSERIGKEDGRKYTIIYRAWDESGNTAWDTVCVEVPHDMSAGAVCASGFMSDGTGIVEGTEVFSIALLSHPAEYETKGGTEVLVKPELQAAAIDPSLAYIGNTAGVALPIRSRSIDVNHDGLSDLLLTYQTEQTKTIMVETASTLTADQMSADAIYDGTIGLHVQGQDGTQYLVGDIFALGTPVVVIDRGGDAWVTPEQPGPETVNFTNSIASIYPNPFNPRTTIRFTLADPARVTIAIFDVNGSLVTTLVDQTLPSGEHTAEWNGTDERGRSVSTGVYFARMVTAGYEATRKMVLIK